MPPSSAEANGGNGGAGGTGQGGGLFASGQATITIASSTFSSDRATGGRGGSAVQPRYLGVAVAVSAAPAGRARAAACSTSSGGTFSLTGSTFSGDLATSSAGGAGGIGHFTESVIGGAGGAGGAGQGGGLFARAGTLALANTTFQR